MRKIHGDGRHANTVRATAGKFAHAPGGTVPQAACRERRLGKIFPTRYGAPKSGDWSLTLVTTRDLYRDARQGA